MLEKLTGFMTEVRGDELVNSTTVIVVFSIGFAIFIGLFDLVLSYVRSVLIAL